MVSDKLHRRRFFAQSAQALLLAASGNQIASAQGKTAAEIFGLDKLNAETEKKDPPYVEALPPDKRVGIAVVGLGTLSIGQILPAFAQSKKARIAALVTGRRDKGLQLAKEYGLKDEHVYSYNDFEQISADPTIAAVYIVLPNSMHREFTVRAAKIGKHVLCEKPMATSVQDCKLMIAACAEAGRKLMIAYRIQYEPNNRAVQGLIRDRKFGDVRIIQATNAQNIGDPDQWRLKKKLSGGGCLPDIGIYCLNTTRFLLSEEPIEVYASTHSTANDPRFSEVEESIAFQLKFPSGVIALCDSTYGAHECRQYRVLAERAWFGLDPAFSYAGLKPSCSEAKGTAEIMELAQIAEKNQFALEIDHFADCISNDKRPNTPGEEGLQDQRLMECLYQSAHERRPIAVGSA